MINPRNLYLAIFFNNRGESVADALGTLPRPRGPLRGRGQGPEGVSYRLPPVSENKRDKGFILLLLLYYMKYYP